VRCAQVSSWQQCESEAALAAQSKMPPKGGYKATPSMTLTITSLRVDERVTPEGNLWYNDVPFLVINATFKIEHDEHLLERTKADAEDYREVTTIDDVARYLKHIEEDDFLTSPRYDGFGRAIAFNDPVFVYLEKFSTFHFREYVADSSVTRAIIAELQYYKQHGKLPSVYRHAEEYIIISHFTCLDRYWD